MLSLHFKLLHVNTGKKINFNLNKSKIFMCSQLIDCIR